VRYGICLAVYAVVEFALLETNEDRLHMWMIAQRSGLADVHVEISECEISEMTSERFGESFARFYQQKEQPMHAPSASAP
jgi:hypothetical protein